MTSVRKLEIRLDQTGSAKKGLAGITGSLGKLTGIGLAAGAAAIGGVALLTGAIVGLGAKLSGLGADAEEMEAKFDVVFGEGAPEAKAALDEFGDTVGRNKYALMEMASTVQDTFVPLGFARDVAADMSLELTKLAVDVGSFNNQLAPDVMRDFQSAIVGNTETVRKYGIVINQERIEAKAYEMGLIDLVVSQDDVSEATERVAIAQARLTEMQSGGSGASEKGRAGAERLAIAQDKAALAQRKHNEAIEKHGAGSSQAEAKAITLRAAIERVTKAQIALDTATTGAAPGSAKALSAAAALTKAELKLETALQGEAGALSETAKAQAIMQIITESTTDAQGDAEATAGSWTNTMLGMKEAITEGATEMGLMQNEALLPLLAVFAPWIKDLIPKAVEIFGEFAGKLSETVGPAMLMIKDAITRIAEAFGVNTEEVSSTDAVLAVFKTGLDGVIIVIQLAAIAMQALATAVEWVKEAIGWLTEKWAELKRFLETPINLPDWLTPGSPTPFELGLRGIADAASDLDWGGLNVQGGGAGGGGGGAGGGIVVNLTYAPAVSLADRFEAEEKLAPFIANALRQQLGVA